MAIDTLPNPASGDRPPRDTLNSVQVMRGIAAMAVAFYHTHLFISRPEMGGVQTWGSVASFGWSGVNFFFVLSGFIILLAHAKDIGRPDRAGNYVWRRVSRVYPVYWLFLTAYIAAAWFGFGSPEFSWAPRNLAASYLLVQLGETPTPPLKVAWTLFYEMSFYAAFLVLILNRFWGSLLVGAWVVAIFVDSFVLGRVDDGWYLRPWNLYFLVGAGAWFAFKRIDPRHGPALLVLGLVLLVAAMAAGLVDPRIDAFQHKPARLVLLSFPFALILLGGALSERRHRWRTPGWALLLGEASYSIYLVHSAVISVLAVLLARHAPADLPGWARFLLVVVPAIGAGVVAHILAERPLLRALRRFSPVRPGLVGSPRPA